MGLRFLFFFIIHSKSFSIVKGTLFFSGIFQILDTDLYGMFFLLYASVYYIILKICLMHIQFELVHNILDMNNLLV